MPFGLWQKSMEIKMTRSNESVFGLEWIENRIINTRSQLIDNLNVVQVSVATSVYSLLDINDNGHTHQSSLTESWKLKQLRSNLVIIQ